ncbi:hypothetical protein [Mycobacteroides abscessus]|uniref:Protease n=6 Tax=Mycobacteroides abscessus TaxID=36809 RepID=A0A1T6ALY8_9MYCO|nr:hypothetical protein [Mycobacteroides abscessus]ESV64581.1 hypothetical protein L833_1967 [Mycobacteroides abscessus MAB_091912_2446]EUA69791.1 hypothetical protein I540_3889 [Mycobacteroides abscessus subsp. bolletii 1513]AGM29890.1 hypothetical protein MASS_3288 [Mycobacteroides abscessus subsp. bolletii 50594]AIC71685.1 hypothetical protein MYCMA_06455 [Mycobacteroides abscessus subsp. massiliense str. GO 06]AMU27136.1 hypothetical protein A3N96_18530 [Mycobacteroides abscessus]
MTSVGDKGRRTGPWGRLTAYAAAVAALSGVALANPIAALADPLIYPGMEIIQRPPGKESLSCTLGFVDPAARVGVTAGHCGGNGPVFTSDGVRIGQLAVAQSNIKPEGPLARDDYRIDYEGIAFDDGVPINNVLPNGLRLGVDPAVVPRDGLPVCRVGITTGEACGAIAGFGNGWFLVDGVPAEHGDSGSAVYTVTSPGNAAIVGIVSARFTANQTRRESTVALSWPTVQQQIRNDIAASRRPEIASPVASNPQAPPPPAINPQAPPMVLPPAPSDDRPSGPARMVVP